MTIQTVKQFINESQGKVLIAGYGSLLSHYSRLHFSQIDCLGLPVMLEGWQRAWITRSLSEKQTYVGAVPKLGACLNASLIALELDANFHKREQDYRFTRISPDALAIDKNLYCDALNGFLQQQSIYICETLDVFAPENHFPVNYSYILTCLSGCYAVSGMEGVNEFLTLTHGWDGPINDDVQHALYPRAAPPEDMLIDILERFLGNRT